MKIGLNFIFTFLFSPPPFSPFLMKSHGIIACKPKTWTPKCSNILFHFSNWKEIGYEYSVFRNCNSALTLLNSEQSSKLCNFCF